MTASFSRIIRQTARSPFKYPHENQDSIHPPARPYRGGCSLLAPAWPATVEPGIDGRRQRVVGRLKASPAYTAQVIGALLRTENTGTPFNPATYQGQIRSVKENGQGRAVIAFSKAGNEIDGVNVYMERKGDAAPTKVGLFTHTPAVDPTPLAPPGVPETRTYTIVPVIKDQEVGLRGAAVSVVGQLGGRRGSEQGG